MKKLALLVLVVCMALPAVSSAGLLREIWDGGRDIDQAIELANSGTPADNMAILDKPEEWVNIADNYSARLTGWLTIPATGEYTFYVAGDDYNRMYVSQDDDPANAVEIARVDGWTSHLEWGKYESQKAAPMELTEGQVLYFEGIMQEGGGGDSLTFGWTGPDVNEVTFIPGEFFSHPYEGLALNPSPADGATGIVDVVASWSAPAVGEDPVYNVYAGTDPDAMDLIAEDLTETSLVVGSAGVDLDLETTYYWRVDVDGVEGVVWSFTTEDTTFLVEGVVASSSAAADPSAGEPQVTADGTGLNENGEHSTNAADMWLGVPAEGEAVSIQYALPRVYQMAEMTIWNSNTDFESIIGYGFKDTTIETSVDGETWTVLAEIELAKAPGAATYTGETVDMGGVPAMYVKLTANTNWGGLFPNSGLAEVQLTYTPAHARLVAPADDATGVAVDAALDWYAGRGSVSSDVIINGELAATVEDSTLAPDLAYGMPYVWQVNEDDGTNVWEGDLWNFSTSEFDNVTDANSFAYNNTAEPFLSEVTQVLDPAADLSANGAQVMAVDYSLATGVRKGTSSTQYSSGWTAAHAIDGNYDTGFHSIADDPDKWLQIDFDMDYTLEVITVYNRASCCGERIAGVVVKALAADGSEIYASEPIDANDAITGSIHTFDNGGAGFADVRAIRLEGGTDFLQIMEIETTPPLPTGFPVPVYVSVEDSAGQIATVTAVADDNSQQTINAGIDALIAAGVDMSSVVSLTTGVGDPVNPVAGSTGTATFSAIRVGTPMSFNVVVDVTNPGDEIVGVPNDDDWPGGETPDLCIDNNDLTKYLHFKGETEPTGIQVTPAVGPTVVTGLTLTTANDSPNRDPIFFQLYGSNDGIDGTYEMIAEGDVVDFAGEVDWPRFTMNETEISFENDVAYTTYKLMFTAVRDASTANSMQIADIELMGVSSL